MNDFTAPEAPAATATGTPVVTNLADIQLPDAPPAKSSGGGGAKVMVTTPAGQVVSRNDYARALATKGWTRTQIKDHLIEITGDKTIRYQTVFQMTKDLFPKRAKSGESASPAAPVAPVVAEEAPTY